MAVEIRLAALIGEKQARENRRISIAEVARECHTSREVVYKWMHGEVKTYDPKIIEAICRYFGVNVGRLLRVVPDPEQELEREGAG